MEIFHLLRNFVSLLKQQYKLDLNGSFQTFGIIFLAQDNNIICLHVMTIIMKEALLGFVL